MMKKSPIHIVCYILVFTGLYSCDSEKPYLKHSMPKFERLSDDCKNYDPKFSMVSNAIGERYEFQKCLNTSYDGHYTAERRGDTVEVRITKAEGPEALFRITLDINTWPRYNYLTIDGNTIRIIPAAN